MIADADHLASKHDKAITAWVLTARKPCQAASRVRRESLCQLRVQSDHLPVVACVRDQQDQPLCTQVPLLRRSPALDELDIAEMSFRLDERSATFEFERRIATSQIPGDWDGNLDLPSRRRTHSRSEPREQRQVATISDRITTRMKLRGELQSDSGGNSRDEVNRHGAGIAPLDLCNQLVADADPTANLSKAQPSKPPCITEIAGNSDSEPASASAATGIETFARGHHQILAACDHLPITGHLGVWSQWRPTRA